MAKCGAGECEVECKNGCGCIASSDEPESCQCWCFGGLGPPKVAVLEGSLGPPRKVNLNIRGARGSEVAIALSKALRVHLAVPTSLLDKRLSVRLKNTPIRAVIKHLGFIETRRASGHSPRKRSR